MLNTISGFLTSRPKHLTGTQYRKQRDRKKTHHGTEEQPVLTSGEQECGREDKSSRSTDGVAGGHPACASFADFMGRSIDRISLKHLRLERKQGRDEKPVLPLPSFILVLDEVYCRVRHKEPMTITVATVLSLIRYDRIHNALSC